MSRLFVDLYRYRQRETRENQEDWLTECLAATMRALPPDCMSAFLANLTGQSQSAIASVAGQLEITTQVSIEREGEGSARQRPDMIIWVGNQPWLMFENKVAHSVAEDDAEGEALESQLHRYARWLGKQRLDPPDLTKALVFLTHRTPVPAHFLDEANPDPAYAGLARITSTWSQLARSLAELTGDHDQSSVSRAMVEAYRTYLEKHGMSNDYPAYKDLASLSAFIEVSDSLEKLVNDMYRRVERFGAFSTNTNWAVHSSSEGTFSAWRYFAPTQRLPAGSFIQTGIWFPELSDGWFRDDVERQTHQAVTSAPKVFLLLANDDDHKLADLKHPGGEWLELNSDLFAFRDFASFGREPTDRANAIIAWLDDLAAKLKRVVES